MTPNILYTFRRCPYAMRARMALAYAGIELELREILLKDKPQDMLNHSPKGTVPVVITSDDKVVDESLDVMYWALEQNDPDNWQRCHANGIELIQSHDNDFKPLLDKYKYADRNKELSESEHRNNTLSFIKQLNLMLIESPYLAGQKLSICDIAIFPFIRQYAMVNKQWFDEQPYPALQTWLSVLLDSELFKSIMKKYKLYNDGHSYLWPEALTKHKEKQE